MPTIKVYPTHENALNIRHPVSGPLVDTGSLWEFDGFTKSMLTTNTITDEETRGHKSERPKIDHSVPPAHAVRRPKPAEATDDKPDDKPADKPAATPAPAPAPSSPSASSVKQPSSKSAD